MEFGGSSFQIIIVIVSRKTGVIQRTICPSQCPEAIRPQSEGVRLASWVHPAENTAWKLCQMDSFLDILANAQETEALQHRREASLSDLLHGWWASAEAAAECPGPRRGHHELETQTSRPKTEENRIAKSYLLLNQSSSASQQHEMLRVKCGDKLLWGILKFCQPATLYRPLKLSRT